MLPTTPKCCAISGAITPNSKPSARLAEMTQGFKESLRMDESRCMGDVNLWE